MNKNRIANPNNKEVPNCKSHTTEKLFLPLELEWGYDLYYADEIEDLCYKEIILQKKEE